MVSRKLFLTALALCVYSAYVLRANADVITAHNYCNQRYIDVKNVYILYIEKIPYTKESMWEKVIENIRKKSESLLIKENIKLHTNFKNKDYILKNDKNALVVELFYSYADGNLFTIPLSKNGTVTWLEISRLIKGGDGQEEISKYKTEYVFSSLSTPPSLIELSSAPYGLIENVVCDIMQNTAGKKCTNRTLFSENELVSMAEPCEKKYMKMI